MKISKVDLHFAYRLLFAISLILINPWGVDRGGIWVEPKVETLIFVTTLNIAFLLNHRKKIIINNLVWKTGFFLWMLFLSLGFITTLLSPFPWRSIFGQSALGDGWAYWLILATFTLSNSLVIQVNPNIFRSQVQGIILGGIILALSIFPQVVDWHIDYTRTTGQISLVSSHMLESTIWKSQMPIGLFSNRGYSAFVLSVVEILILLVVFWGWIKLVFAIPIYFLLNIALICTQTRAGILAVLVAKCLLILRFYYKSHSPKIPRLFWVCLFVNSYFLISYLVFRTSVFLSNIKMDSEINSSALESFSTGRFHLWGLAIKGIIKHPFMGWGFDGFGIAFPFIADWTGSHRGYLPPEKVLVSKILEIYDYTFDYLGIDGAIHTGLLMTNKAHNLFLDTALSVGIIGFIAYFSLLIFFALCLVKTSLWGVESLVAVFLVYTFTWFETAQFSHLIWWLLSVGIGGFYTQNKDLNNYKHEKLLLSA